MLKLSRVTKVKVLSLVLVYILNFDLFEILAAILEKGLLTKSSPVGIILATTLRNVLQIVRIFNLQFQTWTFS